MARDTEAIKSRTSKKHDAIRASFVKLYDEKRLRYDDVITKLAVEYHLAESTIERVVRYPNNK